MPQHSSRAIRCVAFPFDTQPHGCDAVPPPKMDYASSALKAVFDGNCPFIFPFSVGNKGYCVVCSCEPNRSEIELIKAEAQRAPAEPRAWMQGNRSQVFTVGSNPEI